MNCNIIGVDWEALYLFTDYEHSARTSIRVGKYVGKMFSEMLFKKLGVNPNDVHVIGHSLGAHVGGHLCRTVEKGAKAGKIKRLTGKCLSLLV